MSFRPPFSAGTARRRKARWRRIGLRQLHFRGPPPLVDHALRMAISLSGLRRSRLLFGRHPRETVRPRYGVKRAAFEALTRLHRQAAIAPRLIAAAVSAAVDRWRALRGRHSNDASESARPAAGIHLLPRRNNAGREPSKVTRRNATFSPRDQYLAAAFLARNKSAIVCTILQDAAGHVTYESGLFAPADACRF
jgi:hypothetical protein